MFFSVLKVLCIISLRLNYMEETFAWGLGNCRPAGGRPCITRAQIFVHCVFPFNANGIDA